MRASETVFSPKTCKKLYYFCDVMAAYDFPVKTMTGSQCVAELFKLYQQLTK